jgi:hypothetical protein
LEIPDMALRIAGRLARAAAIVAVVVTMAMLSGCSAVLGDHPFSSMPGVQLGKPAATEFRAWSAHPWVAVTPLGTKACDLTAFALTTARRPARLVADGVEQEIDTSWTFHERVEMGVTRVWTFEFLDPRGGALLDCQQVSVSCVNESGASNFDRALARGCPKVVAAKAQRKALTQPQLVASVMPVMALYNPAIGGAAVTIRWAIEGPITEGWYCRRFEVEWIDSTRSSHEEDCAPWPAAGGPTSWKFTRIFPPSPEDGWTVVGRLLGPDGKTIAAETARVRVLGG